MESATKCCIDNLRDAYNKYILPTMKDSNGSCDLVTDGGPENKTIHEFTAETAVEIRRLVAQKDIIFSNSLIEFVNKTIKYRHLFQENLPDFSTTVKYLEHAIPTYNNRPHSSPMACRPGKSWTASNWT